MFEVLSGDLHGGTDKECCALATITKAGLVSGVLDLSDALIFYGLRGVKPVLILQSVASGLLGRAAFSGGAASAVLGTLCHFTIAFTHDLLFGALPGNIKTLLIKWL